MIRRLDPPGGGDAANQKNSALERATIALRNNRPSMNIERVASK
jgi:hypothetical protein